MSYREYVAARRTWSPVCRSSLLLVVAGMLTGCSRNSAPAVILFGAYFPDWLLFALLAIAFALAARIVFTSIGFGESLPFPLFTYLSIGILIAGLIDLLWLDH